MSYDRENRWKITDTDVPFSHVVLWYLKMSVPALLFVLVSCVICYFTVDFIAGTEIKHALKKNGLDIDARPQRPFSDPNYWKH
ncbi:MAG TPA: hypothetical protein VGM54_13490 [Chthoniobacter sp.]